VTRGGDECATPRFDPILGDRYRCMLYEADPHLALGNEQAEERRGGRFRNPKVAANLMRRYGAFRFDVCEDGGVEIVPPRLGRDIALISRQWAARRYR